MQGGGNVTVKEGRVGGRERGIGAIYRKGWCLVLDELAKDECERE